MSRIDSVSPTFAFACAHPLQWALVCPTSKDKLVELDDDGRAAFAVAAEHIQASVVALLNACLHALRERAKPTDKRWKSLRAATVDLSYKRMGTVKTELPGTGRVRFLYIGVEPDAAGATMRVFASIEASSVRLDVVEAILRKANRPVTRDGDCTYVGDAEIAAGATFAAIATTLADQVWPVVLAFADKIGPTK